MAGITIKTKKELAILREGGRRLSTILQTLAKEVKPNVSAAHLEMVTRRLIAEGGDRPAFLNYKPYGANRPYPAALCVSRNDEVVHGIPNEGPKILKSGDIVSLDLGLIHGGLFTDMAITVPVGKIDRKAAKLLRTTRAALEVGIAAVRSGGHTGDIGAAIEAFVNNRYGIVRELAGHGVGYGVHEDPYVPNYGLAGQGPELREGMVIAIEPMLNEGGDGIKLDRDGFTYRTADGSRSAHFEHTIVVTAEGAEILTAI